MNSMRNEQELQNQQIYYMQQQQGIPPQSQMMQEPQNQPMYGIPAQYQQQPSNMNPPTYQPQYQLRNPYETQQVQPPPQVQPIYVQPIQTQYQPSTIEQYNNGEKTFVEHNDGPSTDYSWRNVFYAILFYISLIGTGLGAYLFFQSDLFDIDADTDSDDTAWDSSEDVDTLKFPKGFFAVKLPVIFAGIGTGAIFTFFWLAIIMCCASSIIKLCLLLAPVGWVLSGLGIYQWVGVDGIAGIIVSFIMAAIFAIYACSVWSKIPFATVCLQIAVSTFRQFKAPLFVNVFMMILSIGLMLCDTFSGTYIYRMKSDGFKHILGFIALVCYFWHIMVCFNVAHTAACGVMASWFFGQETSGVTYGSFKRAITTSFGSICFGSLLTAIIRALRVLASMAQNDARDNENSAAAVVCACFECLLSILGDILEYFNGYVYVRIAVYGKGYIESAKETFELFKQTGVDVIINDDLTGTPITVGAILCGILVIVATAFANVVSDANAFSCIIAAVFGIVLYVGSAQVLTSYVMALFVCWAENPAEFSLNRPEEFNKMIVAANNRGHSTKWAHVGNV